MERIYKEKLDLAENFHYLYTHAGIGAGMSIGWALVQPDSILGAITTLFMGFMGGSIIGSSFGFQKGFYPASFEGNCPLEKTSLVTAAHIASFLTPAELAQLNVSQTTRYQVAYARNKVKELDLTNSGVSNEGLQDLLKLYPALTNLKITNCENITEDGALLLADTLKDRSLKRFHFTLMKQEVRFPPRQWWIPLQENLNFSRMESFTCPYNFQDLSASFLEKISSSPLKEITCWPSASLLSSEPALLTTQTALLWLQALPKTLENLDFRSLELTEEMVDLIMEKFDPTMIKRCQLRFHENPQIGPSTSKMRQLLEFLPLSEMTEIRLTRSHLTTEDIQRIASRIARNEQLKTLIVDSGLSAKDMHPLVLSINTPTLSTVRIGHAHIQMNLNFRLKNLLKFRLILNSVLRADHEEKPSWRLNRFQHVETTLQDKHAGDSVDDLPLLVEARELFQVVNHLYAGGNITDRQIELIASLNAHLDKTPMPHILRLYSNLYNILHPDAQIAPADTLQQYGELANPPEDLSQLTPLKLIQRLDELLQIEEERINDPALLDNINAHLFYRHRTAKEENLRFY